MTALILTGFDHGQVSHCVGYYYNNLLWYEFKIQKFFFEQSVLERWNSMYMDVNHKILSNDNNQ